MNEPQPKTEDRPEMLAPFGFDFAKLAIDMVWQFHYGRVEREDIYIVWMTKTLKNWKAILSTNLKDNSIYEVTHNGETNETYIDHYLKVTNIAFNHEMRKAERKEYVTPTYFASYIACLED